MSATPVVGLTDFNRASAKSTPLTCTPIASVVAGSASAASASVRIPSLLASIQYGPTPAKKPTPDAPIFRPDTVRAVLEVSLMLSFVTCSIAKLPRSWTKSEMFSHASVICTTIFSVVKPSVIGLPPVSTVRPPPARPLKLSAAGVAGAVPLAEFTSTRTLLADRSKPLRPTSATGPASNLSEV